MHIPTKLHIPTNLCIVNDLVQNISATQVLLADRLAVAQNNITKNSLISVGPQGPNNHYDHYNNAKENME